MNIKNINIEKDLDRVMEIWLNSNIDTHDFIEKIYWENNYHMVKEILPQADIKIYTEDDKILGFIGIVENYIAGIFVDKKHRSKGIGYKLLEDAKNRYDNLSLDVYEKNIKAINFYKKNNFIENSRKKDDNNEIEINMIWKKNKDGITDGNNI